MQPGGGLVQDEQVIGGGPRRELRRDLEPLGLAARERGRGLAQPQVAEPHFLEHLEPTLQHRLGGEEVHRLVHRLLQHLADVAALVGDLEHVGPVPPALALLAGHVHVLDEVHLELLETVALAGLAAAAGHVEREGAGAEPERLGARQPGEEPPDLVERLHVRDRIGAGRAPDRLLVDEPDALEMLQSPQRVVGSRHREVHLEVAGHRPVERVVHEGRLPGAGHPGHARQGVERDPDRDVLQVVGAGALEHEGAAAFPAGERQGDRVAPAQIARGQRARVLAELGLGAREHHGPAALARAGAHLDHVVGRLDQGAIVLDDHHRVAPRGELAAKLGQPRGVPRMQPDGRLVEHVERAGELGPELVGEVDPLRLPARQGARLPREREVAEAHAEQEGELGA
jgi:hypothetical protein